MKITGTFLDEISHDIPHQNWGKKEWEKDFQAMKEIGIDTVIMIRCGFKRFITYPSTVLCQQEGCYEPPLDLVELYLDLSEKYGMDFYFGTYDSGNYWHNGEFEKEAELSKQVVDEVWAKYGHKKAFKGWYLSLEVSQRTAGIVDVYAGLGRYCKAVSGGLPVMISPYIAGVKAVSSSSSCLAQEKSIGLEQHERDWNEIMSGIKGAVDIVAFQDGHVEFHELADYLILNTKLAKKHGLTCWTNVESFDRDMPIKFLPIKWEKMLLKLRAAQDAACEKAITFEFSHFMSPNSCYPAAKGLYDRYREHYKV